MTHDVSTRSNAVLLSINRLTGFFNEVGLSVSATNVRSYCHWNGQENVFYFTGPPDGEKPTWPYLIRIERPGKTLKLVAKEFSFGRFMGHFNTNWETYIYPGPDNVVSSGVYLHNIPTDTDRMIVAPTTNQYEECYPVFYKDSVIYLRSNAVWQVSLTTSNTTRLFPPQE
ncbi:MAG: hypothetical protein JWM68_5527 [Verrucomicrobiales bacterium]|nr:hypothetical protein [Verrucomicrobiales bacterium]